jgi:PPK2 family polyphosphate:nucleotide phosphotransferase
VKKIDPDDFRVKPDEKVDLHKWPTKVAPVYASKKEYREMLRAHTDDLSRQQGLLYASNKYALLLIFQALDAAGKDGAIQHVMSGVNPQGCQVYSFKHPSGEELEHDFLWNALRRLPERGKIGIFNRSYYEEVLIVRVHPTFLRGQNLPEEVIQDKNIWEERYRSILDFERHLNRNGTRILKFFLHLSKAEQRRRFLKRIDTPEKNWKFSMADIEERKFWPQYKKAYDACLSATSTRQAPWYIVPADDKPTTRLIVSQVILDTIRGLELSYPKTTPARKRELDTIRKLLIRKN